MSTYHQQVYFFAQGETEGNASMKAVLGGKGANLAEMTSLGLPVPPGFTISTGVCQSFYRADGHLPLDVKIEVDRSLARVESLLGKGFGNADDPLLVSVRSGARASMPGMMDTILNLGLNDDTVEGLAKTSGNPAFAWDSYRRFIQMYANVVMDMDSAILEKSLEALKECNQYEKDSDISVDHLKMIVAEFKQLITETTGNELPMEPKEQLWGAIEAVFSSWNNDRAITYRRLNNIADEWGTAVNVQSMVFGNLSEDSGTGVAFTRDPSTGEKAFFGEYLMNAQGEDVVAGIRTPHPITKEAAAGTGLVSLEEECPDIYQELVETYQKLELHYQDMQDIEFTIEQGKLWLLQTRSGKRTARAALQIAVDMLDEGLINDEQALMRIDPVSLDQLLHPSLDANSPKTLLAKGLPASPGGVSGRVVFSSEDAVAWKEKGENVILVRVETSPEDIEGMVAAEGVLTGRGGMTSHAAVVARGMGKCCVAGCSEIQVNDAETEFLAGDVTIKQGDVITLDGSTGEVFLGEVDRVPAQLGTAFERIMDLADSVRTLGVCANADTREDAQTSVDFGAEGIGLTRTEHMFFASERIDWMRRMILADNKADRQEALDKLLPMQREDFLSLFEVMGERPVTIRLLDPPLHEFLPHNAQEEQELADRMGIPVEQIHSKAHALYEFNPMLGHRGCRLAISYPEIYRMQAQAIAEAAAEYMKAGNKVTPEIMIPLITGAKELELLRADVEEMVAKVQTEQKIEFDCRIGTMIELPRAVLKADEIAEHADFFSFGTNDLTQTCLGLSRDDSGRFLKDYVAKGVYPTDPFLSIDQEGVGRLVEMGVELGRKTQPNLKLGTCGEHGGDPASIEFFARAGIDYVSCSPYRVPVARLAAAQVAIKLAKEAEEPKLSQVV